MADHLFNEDSQYCVVPNYLRNYAKVVDMNDDGYVTAKEEDEAIKILNKLKKQKQKQAYLRHHRT